MPKREATLVPTLTKEDRLEEAHQLLLEIKHAQLEAMTLFQDSAPKGQSSIKSQLVKSGNHLVRVEEPSTLSDLPDSTITNSLGPCFEIEYSPVQTDLSLLASTSIDKMAEPSISVFENEKMIGKIVVASLEKLLCCNKELFSKKMPTKKSKPELVVSEKFEKLDKKLEKLQVFMKSRGMDQYIDIDDDDDEELELKQTTPMTYKMSKVAKYDSNGYPKPFENKGKTYPSLEIFADVIEILVVESKALETVSEKEKEKEPEEEGVEGPQAAEEEEKKKKRDKLPKRKRRKMIKGRQGLVRKKRTPLSKY
ncbi:hypothetical protein JCGZ_15551 [Jatropha curcas]|uniref:Uncharacterized protein n=1 Tax=Jatropha curcas TaxID=180498 RepID=A0A067K377_JATCU|nr:hypothetical protein JCGZ_15551 [Jatropha curcas]